ncbi:MAG: hypothetical protein JWN00_559, partial [Actinomycetia bacterium]|nr:hypothetical protein [Actinomycetes bacterium]
MGTGIDGPRNPWTAPLLVTAYDARMIGVQAPGRGRNADVSAAGRVGRTVDTLLRDAPPRHQPSVTVPDCEEFAHLVGISVEHLDRPEPVLTALGRVMRCAGHGSGSPALAPGIPPSCGFLGAWSPAEIGGSPLHVDQATAAAREAEQREYLL